MQKEETQNQKERNKMKKTILAVLATGFSCALLVTQQAKAATITGELDLGGSVSYDSTSLAAAKQVKTWYNVFGKAGLTSVTGATGDFSGIALGSDATMNAPWIFNPSTPILGLWTVGGFTFDLASSTIVSQSSTFLNITGTGTISGNGFDPTQGTWSFTSTSASGGTSVKFGFTASTTAPDGGSAVALLGIALAGIEGVRRMFRARKA